MSLIVYNKRGSYSCLLDWPHNLQSTGTQWSNLKQLRCPAQSPRTVAELQAYADLQAYSAQRLQRGSYLPEGNSSEQRLVQTFGATLACVSHAEAPFKLLPALYDLRHVEDQEQPTPHTAFHYT